MDQNQRQNSRSDDLNVIGSRSQSRSARPDNTQKQTRTIKYSNISRDEQGQYRQEEVRTRSGRTPQRSTTRSNQRTTGQTGSRTNARTTARTAKAKSAVREEYDAYSNEFEEYEEYEERERQQRPSSRRGSGKNNNSGGNEKTLKNDIFGWIVLGVQGVLSIMTIVVLLILNVLPLKLFIPIVVILAILWVAIFLTQLKRIGKLPLVGKIISILVCIFLIVANYYMIITNKAIETVTEETVYNSVYLDVIVLKDDPAENIRDAKDYTFGTQATYQPLNLNQAIDEIESEVGKKISTKDYDSVMNQISALYSHEVGAVIYNRNFKSTIQSVRENFEDEVRVIKTIELRDTVSIKSNSNVNVTSEPFLFYISGNDEYGELTVEGGRSDVNIIVAVNPVSREILMITTPRDYYVIFPGITNGTRDKLTHAGVYGTQCQLDTLNELYDINIDYYCKVNFSSLIDIVNAIGGVDVYNEMEFEFDESDGLIIPEGWVHLDGYTALCFCRERHSFEDGDAARARHQQAVIEAIINKLLSSTGFSAYSQLIKTLERCCVTNMPKESISALVKKQLSEGGSWNITKVAAEGLGMLQTTYSMGNMGLYVTMPYAKSLQNIRTMLDQLYNGEPVTALMMDEEYDDYSLVDEPGPVPETSEEDEDGYTIVRVDLVDADGNKFGTEVRHIDELDNDKLIRVEYLDLNGNKMTAEEVEAKKKGSTLDDEDDETTTEEENSDDDDDETTTEEDTEEENSDDGGGEGGDEGDE